MIGRKEVKDPMSWWNRGKQVGQETSTSPSSSAVLQVLLFPNNLFPSLTWSSFQVFTEVFEIDLTGNQVSQPQSARCCRWYRPWFPQVPQVTPSVAPVLPTLGVLRLGSNLLTSLPDRCFTACPGLIELYLNNNTIQTLRNHTFSGLHRLEVGRLATKPDPCLTGGRARWPSVTLL